MSNADLPARDRFPFWAELVSRELAPLTLSSMNAGRFPAWASVLDLGSVRVAAFSSPPAHLKRTWADIRRADPGTYQLTFVSGTPLWINQRRQYGGQVCDSSHIMGWAKDTKADGYCVFLRAHYPTGGYDDGPWACPMNVTKNWDWWAPQGISSVSIEKVYAP
ncbi:hypothetical protein [Streptomyces achromogenes]|uniref:hypothetical protein n=1 Tax=Streptomyces achromogenes TaxID=67255 RepID=UPI0036A65D21